VVGVSVDEADPATRVGHQVDAVPELCPQLLEDRTRIDVHMGRRCGGSEFAGTPSERETRQVFDPNKVTVCHEEIEQTVGSRGRDRCQRRDVTSRCAGTQGCNGFEEGERTLNGPGFVPTLPGPDAHRRTAFG
jgi:hypothetical protein